MRTNKWVVSTFAGSGDSSFLDGTGEAAKFANPKGIAIDKAGNLYVADAGNHRIRKVTPSGVVSILAGGSGAGYVDFAPGTTARFNNPTGITIDAAAANLYVADAGNNRIRGIALSGSNLVTTIAGGGTNTNPSYDTTRGTFARFNRPTGVAIDATAANLYVADAGNNRIRRISLIGTNAVSTIAGGGTNVNPSYDTTRGIFARFNRPIGITFDTVGVVDRLYVADSGNHRIRSVTLSGTNPVITIAGSATTGSADGSFSVATFNGPYGITLDGSNLFVADWNNNRIRMVILTQQMVNTFTGKALSNPFSNGDALYSATFKNPAGIVKDNSGNFYVTDAGNHRIRKITFVRH